MIACYAWTELMLLNVTNIRVNTYPNETADLFIT
ncbi:hypothetical protein Desdi_3202 [Desulfitobacterium dichloroeliminans LMG P-21439]|uniref:Uncharacterized protein n=1 Tax=Desulfitobacterium dichloroeliminans (strain LMG P-21439 / DCA1) TaxID=871963 RepID=L0FD82_DESDL|nr:hypothetical protein Desdi_3202 [Desulfitobacterium dichloroeliminans LMG P-21439]